MKHSDKLTFETDADGLLFAPQMRERIGASVVSAPDAAAFEAIGALRWAAKELHLGMDRMAETHGLSEGRLQLLMRLRHHPDGVAMGELAGVLNVSPRNVTGLIDLLERDGLVERVPDPSDRRSVLARLSPEGRSRVDMLWQGIRGRQLPLTVGFAREELAQLRHLCLRLVMNMKKSPEEVADR